ncbi:MAG: F0F1 ATP synthase subunit gamma [Halioglobus sp.]
MSDSNANLQRKITSAGDLQTVVRTMKALAASSIGQYENAVRALGDYYRTVELGLGVCFRHQQTLPTAVQDSDKRVKQSVGVVVFGSDQGLVGQFNEQVVEQVMSFLAGLPDSSRRVWAVGERVNSRLIDAGTPTMGLFAVPNSVQTIASLVGKILLATQGDRDPDELAELYLFYNRSQSGAGYEPVSQRLLPLDASWRRQLVELPWPTGNLPEVTGDNTATLRALIREYLFISLFRACAESLASENASRLAAMQRAEKNIDDLLLQLRGTFHRVRQSGIDEELFDVVAGFDALSSEAG